jgi:prevent-host-death family protein
MREVPITDAKNALTALVHQAEAGKPVRLTRRGRPVAVLLSDEAYRRLEAGATERRDLWEFVESWRSALPSGWEGITLEEARSWRDRTSGRSSPWRA